MTVDSSRLCKAMCYKFLSPEGPIPTCYAAWLAGARALAESAG